MIPFNETQTKLMKQIGLIKNVQRDGNFPHALSSISELTTKIEDTLGQRSLTEQSKEEVLMLTVDLKNLVERQHWQFMMLKHFAEKMQSAMMLQCLLSREQQPQPPPPPPPPSRASDRTFKPIRRVESQGSHKIKYAPYPIHLQPNPHHHQQQQQQQQQQQPRQQQQQPQVTTAWMAPTIDTISLEVAEDDHQQLVHYDHNFGSGCFSTNA